MVQTTESRHRNRPATCARSSGDLSSCRGLLLQPEMGSIVVIIADILGHQPFEMSFVENNHMVEYVPPAISDKSFRDAILPWTAEAGLLGRDSKALYRFDDLTIEVGCMAKDQKPRRGVVRESLAQLL